MNLFKRISPSSSRFQEVEFFVLLGWALLFPAKLSYLYFLGFTLLLAVLTLRKIFVLKSIAWTRFSTFLAFFTMLFVWSAFFSPHPIRSLLFASDILLVAIWFLFFYIEKSDVGRYLRLLAAAISLSSLVVLVFFAFHCGNGPAAQIFRNPILQGIASSLAALVFLHALMQKYSLLDTLLLAINVGAVVVSASKAAFLGLALIGAVMIFSRKRRWLIYFVSLLVLLSLFPNPLRRMVRYSLTQDPYVLNRLDIWNMSARMLRHHVWTGVGPDLFEDAARQFNFPQVKGPARYFKLPESPHSDYWKIIAENGLPGLIFVFLFLFFAIRRLLSPPRLDLPKLLLAFLLFQMLLINCIFNFFFLLVFFLLLHDFFQARHRFVTIQPGFRIFFSSLLVFTVVVLYLFPYIADRLLDAASLEKSVARRFTLLNRAALCSPLDERVPLAKAEILRSFARSRSSLEAWTAALDNLRLVQKLDGYGTSAYLLESALFTDFLAKRIKYPAMGEEILAPLRRAEKNDPFDPFLKLQQAIVLREFGRLHESRRLALAALELEPEYVAALWFIHDLDGRPATDAAWLEKMSRLQAKAVKLHAEPGSYLFKLYRLPEKVAARQ
jgi:O-antigen ligase